jgi:hypothetical protein
VRLPFERIIDDVQPTHDAVKNRPQDGMIDAPRNSDGKHAPETPTTNARRPASIFHFGSPIWATLVLRPNRRCHATTTQTSAVQYTAGMETKTHLGGQFRCHKSCGLPVTAQSWSAVRTILVRSVDEN